jgi:hypothetical protein
VEMHRLREKLKKYYSDEGLHHSVVLTLHAGSYIPHFIRQQEAPFPPTPGSSPVGGASVEASTPSALGNLVDGEVGLEPEARADAPPQSAVSLPVPLPVRRRKLTLRWVSVSVVAASALALSLFLILAKLRQAAAAHAGLPPQPVGPVAGPMTVRSNTPIRIISGYLKDNYIDSSGYEFSGDRYFQGGDVRGPDLRSIARTRDSTLFA